MDNTTAKDRTETDFVGVNESTEDSDNMFYYKMVLIQNVESSEHDVLTILSG